MSHYSYVLAFLCIALRLIWRRFKLQADDLLFLSAGADFIAFSARETSLITINHYKRTSTSARGGRQYFLPGVLMIVGIALFLHWSLLLSVAFGSAILEGRHVQYFIEQITLTKDASSGIVLLFLLMLLLTNFMTNVSDVAVGCLIAAVMMQLYRLGHLEISLPVAFIVRRIFSTPSSYPTHLMIEDPGDYSNQDFLKRGLPVLFVYSLSALYVLL